MMRGYDAYITREPSWMHDDEPPVYRCSTCGCFLAQRPDAEIHYMQIRHCSGKAQVIDGCTHDDAVIRIIGEEHRHETFSVAYVPSCGGRTASHYPQGDEAEINVSDAPGYEHEPHWFEDEHGSPTVLVRTCGYCGVANEEAIL